MRNYGELPSGIATNYATLLPLWSLTGVKNLLTLRAVSLSNIFFLAFILTLMVDKDESPEMIFAELCG